MHHPYFNRSRFPSIISGKLESRFMHEPEDMDFKEDVCDIAGGQQVEPDANVIETDEHYILDLAVPGIHKEDIRININKEKIVLFSVLSKKENWPGPYVRREFNYNIFRRSFLLPENVVPERAMVQYENGILKVFLPKNGQSIRRKNRHEDARY